MKWQSSTALPLGFTVALSTAEVSVTLVVLFAATVGGGGEGVDVVNV